MIFLAKEILEQSSQIIFISNALKERFLNHPLIKKNKHKLNHKCLVINNGIDPYWLENRTEKREIEPTKILYVGSLVKRKNATKLIHSVLNLRKSGLQCELTIVGEGGSLQKEVEQLASANYPIINYIGAVKDKTKLKEIYNNHHIFALPSNIETFGLVYIEALSQGIPVLYAKNQGIDGTFKEMVGEAIDFNNENGIETGLKKLVENYNSYELEKIDFTRFSWGDIAKTYLNLYKA